MDSTAVATQIKSEILSKIDSQALIEVIDETHKHTKHKGFVEGKYHYVINISSKKLSDSSKIKAHKEVFKSVEKLMPYIHALSIKIKPE
ncbi:BolA/IbaG family iron-sulfur metabolism protein [Francisella sp. SYW-2]|uniref:BolA/IbaG family iron-sulfur metabolism protein n=1 Tax=Francisella TaxID=262 RepID=UPI00123CAEC5|nr:BolA/IbaG family iron-sulfur metabolism protein [Francisella sp. SYW-2]